MTILIGGLAGSFSVWMLLILYRLDRIEKAIKERR